MTLTALTMPSIRATEPEDDWRHEAACRDVDPDLMQPEVATPDEVALAKRVCRVCPVRLQCRQLAMSQSEPYGIHDGEWFGQQPYDPSAGPCEWCGEPMKRRAKVGPTPRFCSDSHRVMARQAREAAASA